MSDENEKIVEAFPSNSKTRKLEQRQEAEQPTKRVEKVVVGSVKKQKKSLFGCSAI